ncbi:MAG TPA: hypothetical protein VHO25_16635 [Polyangiaceae bacterium]|nr:hypothetical protein [Polyangiaceae bacterium]
MTRTASDILHDAAKRMREPEWENEPASIIASAGYAGHVPVDIKCDRVGNISVSPYPIRWDSEEHALEFARRLAIENPVRHLVGQVLSPELAREVKYLIERWFEDGIYRGRWRNKGPNRTGKWTMRPMVHIGIEIDQVGDQESTDV